MVYVHIKSTKVKENVLITYKLHTIYIKELKVVLQIDNHHFKLTPLSHLI